MPEKMGSFFCLGVAYKDLFSLLKSGLTKETIKLPGGEKNRYSLHTLAYHFEDDKMV